MVPVLVAVVVGVELALDVAVELCVKVAVDVWLEGELDEPLGGIECIAHGLILGVALEVDLAAIVVLQVAAGGKHAQPHA